jgi:tRNA(His) 5'-end guanylyltransferase
MTNGKFDSLGDRMKGYYEKRSATYLPRRSYTMMRIDGKAFHSYTKGLIRPFDAGLIEDMDNTAIHLCSQIQGAKAAFVQSDEISILITDFDDIKTDAWFDGNVQKMCSISASTAASKFNQLRWMRFLNEKYNNTTDEVKWVWFEQAASLKLANFDSRVFILPSRTEVENYFIWRQQDTVRNSISSVAQSMFSHKKLNGKNTTQMMEMCWQKGINWNDYDPKYKRGRMIVRKEIVVKTEGEGQPYIRNVWVSEAPPTFTQERDYLKSIIPIND